MLTLKFVSAGGREYEVNLPNPIEGLTSAYLFSFHKSGSTLMDGMVRDYCKPLGIPTFSLFNAAFDSGVPTNEIQKDASICFSKTGCIYTGFRHFPQFEIDLEGATSVLLVRDPRDMLVSLYFSVTKSHVVPFFHQAFKRKRAVSQQLTLDEFVLKHAGEYLSSFNRYQNKLPAKSLVTYRYEDVIYEKRSWLADLVERLSLPKDRNLLREVSQRHDVIPKTENESKHIRQVHPGNYLSKLSPTTIARLNESLAPFLEFYGYKFQ